MEQYESKKKKLQTVYHFAGEPSRELYVKNFEEISWSSGIRRNKIRCLTFLPVFNYFF